MCDTNILDKRNIVSVINTDKFGSRMCCNIISKYFVDNKIVFHSVHLPTTSVSVSSVSLLSITITIREEKQHKYPRKMNRMGNDPAMKNIFKETPQQGRRGERQVNVAQ